MMEGLQTKLTKILSKFRMSEFPGVLSFVFENVVRWDKVRQTVDNMRLNKRPRVLAEVCCMLYQKSRPTKEDALSKLRLLELCDVSLHHCREWFGIQLTEPYPEPPPSVDNIEKEIIRAFKKELRDTIVMMVERKELVFIMVIEQKNTKKGVRNLAPVFFAINTKLEAPFAFYSPKLSSTHPLELFSSAMGYQDYSIQPLKGKDISCLFESIRRRLSGTVALRPPLQISAPYADEWITDYSAHKWKSEYAQSVLSGESKMSTLTVKSTNEWRGTSVFPHLPKAPVLRCMLTIQCKKRNIGVEDVLKELIVRGNIASPVPPWVLSFANRPRNSITLHSQGADTSPHQFDQTDFDNPEDPVSFYDN